MKKVYIVVGSSGDCSDPTEWPVRAFLNEKLADAWGKQAEEKANEIRQIMIRDGIKNYSNKSKSFFNTHPNVFDPEHTRECWDFPDYWVYEVDLDESDA